MKISCRCPKSTLIKTHRIVHQLHLRWTEGRPSDRQASVHRLRRTLGASLRSALCRPRTGREVPPQSGQCAPSSPGLSCINVARRNSERRSVSTSKTEKKLVEKN